MLSDGDSREVTRALGEAGWIGMSWPEALGGRGPHASTRRSSRRCSATTGCRSRSTCSRTRRSARRSSASRRPRSRAAPAGDRPRRARLLPGVLRAGCRERSRLADDPRELRGRPLRRRRAQALDVERPARRLDLPRGAHRFRTSRSIEGISVLVARSTRRESRCARFGTLGGGLLCEVFLDSVEIPAENLVGELNRGWDVLMYTLDFERVTAEKIGGLPGSWTGSRSGSRRRSGSSRRGRGSPPPR